MGVAFRGLVGPHTRRAGVPQEWSGEPWTERLCERTCEYRATPTGCAAEQGVPARRCVDGHGSTRFVSRLAR